MRNKILDKWMNTCSFSEMQGQVSGIDEVGWYGMDLSGLGWDTLLDVLSM
jgi:hypothetical protein